MTTAYPGGIDDFAEASPTYMSDPDSTGRTHDSRHDDVESAVEAIERELGLNPSGANATLAERIAAFTDYGVLVATNRALQVNGTEPGYTALEVTGKGGSVTRLDIAGNGNNYFDAVGHLFRNAAGTINGLVVDSAGIVSSQGRVIPTHYWDETVGRRLFIWDTNNSRWQMVYGDTGWRDISSLLVNGWTGYVWLRRINNYGYFQFSALNPAAATATRCIDFPNGFGPPVLATHHALYCSAHTAGAETSGTGVNILNTPTPSAANVYGHISYPIDGAWPTSLPGTALGAVPQGAGGPDPGTDEWRNAVHDDIDPAIPTGLTDADDVSGWTVDYPEGPTP